jgi:hypothetical protein
MRKDREYIPMVSPKEILYPGGIKGCTKCGETKELDLFSSVGRYHASACRECSNKLAREVAAGRGLGKKKSRNPIINGMKTCPGCQTSKSILDFTSNLCCCRLCQSSRDARSYQKKKLKSAPDISFFIDAVVRK